MAGLIAQDYEGQVGNGTHITRNETGTVPTSAVANLQGVRCEIPGAHRHRSGKTWENFKHDIATNGIRHPIFITVDHGDEPRISEGNHRRDAAVELGLPEVPVEIRYFGHAEQQGSLLDRHARTLHQAVSTSLRTTPTPDSFFDRNADNRRAKTEAAGDEACMACGRKLNPARSYTVHVIDGGSSVLHPDDEAAYVPDDGDLGFWGVGPECAKALPAEFRGPRG